MIYYLNIHGIVLSGYDLGSFDLNEEQYGVFFYNQKECEQYSIDEGYEV